jgi:O-antigen ligase
MLFIYYFTVILFVVLTIKKSLYGIIFLLFNFLLQPHVLLRFDQSTTQISNALIGAALILSLPFRKVKFPETGLSLLAILFLISGAVSSMLNLGLDFLSIDIQNNLFRFKINRVGFLFLFLRYVCNKKDFATIIRALVILGSASAVYTITDYYFHFTYDPNVKQGRAIGLFGDPNFLAANLDGLVPLAYYLFVHGTSKWLKRLYIINIISLIMGIFFTVSRGGLLALCIIGGYITRKNMKKVSTPFIIGLVIIIFSSFAKDLYLKREAASKTVATSRAGKITIDDSAYARIEHVKLSLLLLLKNPLFGVGIYNAPEAFRKQLGERHQYNVIHNAYFSVLAEYGLVGFSLYMGFFLLAFRALARLSRHKDAYYRELALYLRLALFSHLITSCFLGNWLELMLWITIALPVILDQIAKHEQQPENQPKTGPSLSKT